jgi:hypothetical protein
MSGAGNPLGYDYRDPRHVERYGKLVIRNPDGSTEGRIRGRPMLSRYCVNSMTLCRCCG